MRGNLIITQTRLCNMTAIFHGCKIVNFPMTKCDIFQIFAKNIDFGYRSEAVLTSTHNLCFRAKIRKIVYPCKYQFYYIKVGCKGVYIARTCYPDIGWIGSRLIVSHDFNF